MFAFLSLMALFLGNSCHSDALSSSHQEGLRLHPPPKPTVEVTIENQLPLPPKKNVVETPPGDLSPHSFEGEWIFQGEDGDYYLRFLNNMKQITTCRETYDSQGEISPEKENDPDGTSPVPSPTDETLFKRTECHFGQLTSRPTDDGFDLIADSKDVLIPYQDGGSSVQLGGVKVNGDRLSFHIFHSNHPYLVEYTLLKKTP